MSTRIGGSVTTSKYDVSVEAIHLLPRYINHCSGADMVDAVAHLIMLYWGVGMSDPLRSSPWCS